MFGKLNKRHAFHVADVRDAVTSRSLWVYLSRVCEDENCVITEGGTNPSPFTLSLLSHCTHRKPTVSWLI